MINNTTIQEYHVVKAVRAALDYTEELKNIRLDHLTVGKLRTLLQTLVTACNLRLPRDFQVEIIDTPIDDVIFEIGGSNVPDLKFFGMKSFIVGSFEQAEGLSDETRYLDALRVLINYVNIVVFARTDHYLIIRHKIIDDLESSYESSIHLAHSGDSRATKPKGRLCN